MSETVRVYHRKFDLPFRERTHHGTIQISPVREFRCVMVSVAIRPVTRKKRVRPVPMPDATLYLSDRHFDITMYEQNYPYEMKFPKNFLINYSITNNIWTASYTGIIVFRGYENIF